MVISTGADRMVAEIDFLDSILEQEILFRIILKSRHGGLQGED